MARAKVLPGRVAVQRSTAELDNTWRIQQRGVPYRLHEEVDGYDCYVFQRLDPENPNGFLTHITTVSSFWG